MPPWPDASGLFSAASAGHRVKLSEHFDAPIEHVFEMLVDVKRWPEWLTNVDVKEVTGPLDKAGTKVLSVTRILGRSIEGRDEVVEAERPYLWKWAGRQAGMKYESAFRLTPAERGTDVLMEGEYELPAGFFGQVADRLFIEKAMERQMRHSVENFKAVVEATAPVAV